MKKDCYDCCYPQMTNPEGCGCCEGVEMVTPISTYNRPGLSEISYRIGTHGSFKESMIARLTTLKGLTTRRSDDPALALLDAWATVADVLTFYQERIANEGYLRTATERFSVQELAKLVGYRPRPGVSSSVFLAYTLDDKHKEETVIPSGSRVQSVPGPDELPQTFETSVDLKARAQWNNLKPRMTRPQTMKSIKANNRLYLKGLTTNLKPNEPLLIREGNKEPELFWIADIQPDVDNNRTLIEVRSGEPTQGGDPAPDKKEINIPFLKQSQLISALISKPSLTPSSSLKLFHQTNKIFGTKESNKIALSVGEASHGVIKFLAPQLQDTLAPALANANAVDDAETKITVYAMKVKAAPFAHNAPLRPIGLNEERVMQYSEWDIENPRGDAAPRPSFTFDADDHKVTFHNTSVLMGQIVSVSWAFGDDGNIVSEWSPVHTYENDGTYDVTLTIISGGRSSKTKQTIKIPPPPEILR